MANLKSCLITNDVETTSIVNGGLREQTGLKVWKEGMPRLLDLYAKYNIKTTFFFVADFAKEFPEIVKMVQPDGHEVACHGLTHDYKQSFDIMSFEKQKEHLIIAKKILEDISGEEIVSFRAPALRVNEHTPQALIETGFKFDSSVAPQRMDMFMSLGSTKKLTWLKSPRTPYYINETNLARRGNLPIIEVPISSFGFPYIGTFMRIFPFLSNCTRQFLYLETQNSNKVINFLIHPNEVITEEKLQLQTQRRAGNYLAYLLSDVLRQKMKQKNLGASCLSLFENHIIFWQLKQYDFVRVKDIIINLSDLEVV